MNIIEATKKALQENKAISNPDDLEVGMAFLPTNSEWFGVLIVPTEKYVTKEKEGYKKEWQVPGRFWSPSVDAILRNDWELL